MNITEDYEDGNAMDSKRVRKYVRMDPKLPRIYNSGDPRVTLAFQQEHEPCGWLDLQGPLEA